MGITNFFKWLLGKGKPAAGQSAQAESPDLKANKPDEPLPDDSQGMGTHPWTLAPRESHVDAFRFFDARKIRLLRLTTGKSEIYVRFKTKAVYAYYSPDHALLASIFSDLARDRHPGQVIWRRLRAKFQYRQITVGTEKWKPPKQARKRKGGTHGRRKGAKRRKR